jgi:hypothetical protein
MHMRIPSDGLFFLFCYAVCLFYESILVETCGEKTFNKLQITK